MVDRGHDETDVGDFGEIFGFDIGEIIVWVRSVES